MGVRQRSVCKDGGHGMTAHTKSTTGTVEALKDELRQIRRRVVAMVGRCKDPNDPRIDKLKKLEKAVVEDLDALGVKPDDGGPQ